MTAVTVEQYAAQYRLSPAAARVRLELLTAQGWAERRTFATRAAEFTLLEQASVDVVRIHCAEVPKPKRGRPAKALQAWDAVYGVS